MPAQLDARRTSGIFEKSRRPTMSSPGWAASSLDEPWQLRGVVLAVRVERHDRERAIRDRPCETGAERGTLALVRVLRQDRRHPRQSPRPPSNRSSRHPRREPAGAPGPRGSPGRCAVPRRGRGSGRRVQVLTRSASPRCYRRASSAPIAGPTSAPRRRPPDPRRAFVEAERALFGPLMRNQVGRLPFPLTLISPRASSS